MILQVTYIIESTCDKKQIYLICRLVRTLSHYFQRLYETRVSRLVKVLV